MAKASPAAQRFFGHKRPIVIAHRGGAAAGWKKRNTMAAFKAAYELGYRYFETDVIKVKSGDLVIAHGAKNRLTSSLRGTFSYRALQNLTYDEIRQKLRISGEVIPTLEELLNSFPKVKLVIDPKTTSSVEPLAQLLLSTGDYKKAIVGSFHQKRIDQLNLLLGKEKAITKVTIGKASGFLRLNAAWFRKLLRISGRYHPAEVDVYEVPHWFISRAMVAEAHREGKYVVAWTPNSRMAIEKAINKGADGIISDRISLLKEIIESKKDPAGSKS